MRKYLLAALAWAIVTSAALGQTVTPNFDITSTNGGGGGGGGGVTSVACTPVGGVGCTVASPTGAAVVTVDTSGALTPSSVTTSTINGTPTIALTNATGLPVSTGLAGLGTGVAGALAVNVGSAGAPVVNGGALGTPSSATLTNASGTAASLTAGHVTTNANLTGDVTSVGNAATVVKINGTSLSGLATGIVKNTTATGIPSIAIAADFPTLNQSTTGSAATLATGRTISITGDLAYTSPSFDGSGNVTAAGTLASVVTAGTCTSCNLTVDAKGRITAQASGSGGGATLGANTFTAAQEVDIGTAANTSADGLNLYSTTAATVGNQQFSPRVHLKGFGWKTTATAASQPVDWILENQPVQGAANPASNLVISSQINGGGYSSRLTLASTGTHVFAGPGGTFTIDNSVAASAALGIAGGSLRVLTGNLSAWSALTASTLGVTSTGLYTFSSSTNPESPDSGFGRAAAKVPEVNTGTQGSYVGTALVLGPQTVAQLPTCSATTKGARATATDANATTFLGALTGGGANIVPAFCNGTSWLIGEAANDPLFSLSAVG